MPGPAPSDTDTDLLRYVRLTPRPFATADDVDKHTTVGYKQTRNRLDDLVDSGLLRCEKVGNVNLYWLSDAGEDALVSEDT